MDSLLLSFAQDVSHIERPSVFNYPHYYQPHELAIIAASQLQNYLDQQPWFQPASLQEAGKMFGVLVVETVDGTLKYLAGFSGKLAGETIQPHFVPPVYELDRVDAFFAQETAKLDAITQQITAIEEDPKNAQIISSYQTMANDHALKLQQEQERIKEIKRNRRRFLKLKKRELSDSDFEIIETQQRQLSLNNNFFLKEYEIYLEEKIAPIRLEFQELEEKLEQLRKKRKEGSNWLQDWLFDEYQFLNAKGETQDVKSLFKDRIPSTPPAATGDCAAPKLLQYAYRHQLKPITMAEFWYGPAPKSKIRKHGNFYPACRSKCEPVLEFMLQGLDVEENLLLVNPAADKELEIIFEDDILVALNKPAEFLSVPGKTIQDSVYTRMKARYPNATGPLIVHRLDMSTSGILILAKTEEAYHYLQQQFIKRTIDKRYIAILDGIVQKKYGFIDLPLRVDLDNRPYQLVDFEYGKSARTRYEVIKTNACQSLVHFYPITGRTHQLRVHAAHVDGLNAPIHGDDLYGKTSNRLHLHAEELTFEHPLSRKRITLTAKALFELGA